MNVNVRPARYYLSVVPETRDDWAYFTVTVAYRGRGLYGVYKGAFEHSSISEAANGLGEWALEGSQEREDEEYLATHRFKLGDALFLAKLLAPTVGLHSHTRFIQAQEIAREKADR